MTQQELFEIITKIIADLHTTLTEHDKRRAIRVFLAFDDYRCFYGDKEYDAGMESRNDKIREAILSIAKDLEAL